MLPSSEPGTLGRSGTFTEDIAAIVKNENARSDGMVLFVVISGTQES